MFRLAAPLVMVMVMVISLGLYRSPPHWLWLWLWLYISVSTGPHLATSSAAPAPCDSRRRASTVGVEEPSLARPLLPASRDYGMVLCRHLWRWVYGGFRDPALSGPSRSGLPRVWARPSFVCPSCPSYHHPHHTYPAHHHRLCQRDPPSAALIAHVSYARVLPPVPPHRPSTLHPHT